MKQILPPDENAIKLAGTQKRKENTQYRMTRHCISVPCADGTLLYQTMSCGLYLLENGESIEDCADALIAAWLLVPEGYDEQKLVRDMRTIGGMIMPVKKNKTSFTILTTTDCNARCSYCYEMGCKRESMTAQTARDVAAYIAGQCGGEAVSLHWFGGEPLYNREAIEIIVGDLKERGIEFKSSMISNGYYLDAATAKTAKHDWNLTRVQITLDGTRDIYNRTKAYIEKDKNAFDRVLDNISGALDEGISVSIRLNMDEKNSDDLFILADVLEKRFNGKTGFSVYAALLKQFKGKINNFETAEDAAQRCIELQNRINALPAGGQQALQQVFSLRRCMADNDACEVILPDGKLDRCDHFNEANSYGSIYNDKRNSGILSAWKEWEYYPECDGCILYPQCFNLKKCEWLKGSCQQAERLIWMHNAKQRMLTAYQDHLNAEASK